MTDKKEKIIDPTEKLPNQPAPPIQEDNLEGEGDEEEEDDDSGSNPPGSGPVKPPGQP